MSQKSNRSAESSLEEFEYFVTITRDCLYERIIKIDFVGGAPYKLEVKEELLGKKLDQNEKLIKKYKAALDNIANLLTSILLSSEDEYINAKISEENEAGKKYTPAQKKKLTNEIEKKLHLVSRIMVEGKVKEKFILLATAKNSFLKSFSWEINNKIFDSKENLNGSETIYATLQLKFEKNFIPSKNRILVNYFGLETKEQTTTINFDCDIDDIDELIDELNKIKRKINEKLGVS